MRLTRELFGVDYSDDQARRILVEKVGGDEQPKGRRLQGWRDSDRLS